MTTWILALLLFAQQNTATISGRILDSSGAAIPGATVVAKNIQTGLERPATTDETGTYTIPLLPVGQYEVSAELRDQFASQFPYGDELFTEVFSSDPVREKYPLLFMNMRAPGHGAPPSKPHLDLVEANRRQLISAGVPATAIDVSPLCTGCRTDLLFSHRAEKGKTGRMLAVIGIKP